MNASAAGRRRFHLPSRLWGGRLRGGSSREPSLVQVAAGLAAFVAVAALGLYLAAALAG